MEPVHIAIDGIDGCGKTTLTRQAAVHLRSLGYDCAIVSMLPDGYVRDAILLEKDFTDLERAALLRVEAKRLGRKIEELMRNGVSIICDRSPLSFYAYQYYGIGLGKEIDELLSFIPENLIAQPDGLIYVDIDVETSVERFKRRAGASGDELDVFEARHERLMEKVKAGFDTSIEERLFPSTCITRLNGNLDEKRVKIELSIKLDELLESIAFKNDQRSAVPFSTGVSTVFDLT